MFPCVVGMSRAYLKRLPDFEDMEAEEKALDYAPGSDDGLEGFVLELGSWLKTLTLRTIRHGRDCQWSSP